ncbi:MAG: TlyA family RNA methyltransferase [Pseudomonadota bacterium]
MKRKRLDMLCVEQGFFASRQRAQSLILAGKVFVNGQPITKAGTQVPLDSSITLQGEDHPYVSRGGLKLKAALDFFKHDVVGKVALDIGASTGGFTDCLLQYGARHVIAVDVGYGQLAWKLRKDPRVTCIERQNARYLDAAVVGKVVEELGCWPPDLCTIDVSFISLIKILPAVAKSLGPGKPIMALVKPQFEAKRERVNKGGVVKDPVFRQEAIQNVVDWAKKAGYTVDEGLDSPIPGPKGNVERMILLSTPIINFDDEK